MEIMNIKEYREQRKAEMQKLYNSGKTLEEIGDIFGITRQAVNLVIGKRTDKNLRIRRTNAKILKLKGQIKELERILVELLEGKCS